MFLVCSIEAETYEISRKYQNTSQFAMLPCDPCVHVIDTLAMLVVLFCWWNLLTTNCSLSMSNISCVCRWYRLTVNRLASKSTMASSWLRCCTFRVLASTNTPVISTFSSSERRPPCERFVFFSSQSGQRSTFGCLYAAGSGTCRSQRLFPISSGHWWRFEVIKLSKIN